MTNKKESVWPALALIVSAGCAHTYTQSIDAAASVFFFGWAIIEAIRERG